MSVFTLRGSFRLLPLLLISASLVGMSACSQAEQSGPSGRADTAEVPVVEQVASAPRDKPEVAEPPVAETERVVVQPAASGALVANVEAGASAFAVCRSCHTVEVGRNGLGPSLAGVVGRNAGTIEGFNYSDAMAAAGIVWTPENLNDYLQDSAKVVPGNRMSQLFRQGVQDAQKRADIIAYLATQ